MTTRCLETRRRPNGLKYRRYATPEGVTFSTFEVPCTVLRTLGATRLKSELARAERELERKVRNARARTLGAAGWKSTAIANEVGLCDSQVRRLLQRSR